MNPESLIARLKSFVRGKLCWLLGHLFCDPPVAEELSHLGLKILI